MNKIKTKIMISWVKINPQGTTKEFELYYKALSECLDIKEIK
jgi:hypothetical protein